MSTEQEQEKNENKPMKLADLLQWETPESQIRYGEPFAWILRTKAGVYITQAKTSQDFNYKFAVNRVWLKDNEPELYKKCDAHKDKTINVGISIGFDRPNKRIHVVFDPPKNVPQWVSKLNQDKSGTITLSNKRLGEDLWETFGVPKKNYLALKQYLTTEVSKEFGVVEGRKIYEFTYSKDSLQNVSERQKQMKQYEKSLKEPKQLEKSTTEKKQLEKSTKETK